MVLVEAVLVLGLLAVVVYTVALVPLRHQDRDEPAPTSGTWHVAHYDVRHETCVVVRKVAASGRILDEHVVATVGTEDPDYDDRFLAAMSAARQRQALFESEEDG